MKFFKKFMALVFALIVSVSLIACEETPSTPSEYTINWIVEEEIVETDVVKEGEIPIYDGSTPTKSETNDYTYTFSQWTPEIVAATEDKDYVAQFTETSKPKFLPADFQFESLKVVYDGLEHVLEATNLPVDATIVYTNNKRTEPGTQEAKAVVTYYGRNYTYTAVLNIVKCDSVLTIAEKQTVESGDLPVYTVNNTEQVLSMDPIYIPGTYYVDAYAASTVHYNESNHVEILLTVVDKKPLGIEFVSTTMIADGTEKELIATNIPEGCYVEYVNNKLTEVGKTYAECIVYNSNGVLVARINAILTLDYPVNAEFETFLDDFFLLYLGDDYFAWNIYSVDPEKLGFDRSEFGDPEWYSYTKLDEEYRVDAQKEFSSIYTELQKFEDSNLSANQKIAYNKIEEFVEYHLDYYDVNGAHQYSLQNLNYIDQFGGYCSDFATSMEGYTYRTEQDIKDVLSYIKSLVTVYPTYIEYVKDRKEASFPLSDYTLDEMIDYLGDIVTQGKNYYLGDFIKTRINELEFISSEQKTAYCNQFDEYFETYFIPATSSLKDGLEECRGSITSITNEGYWAKYDNGADLFLESLREMIGNPNLTLEEYSQYIDLKLVGYTSKINEIIAQYRSLGTSQAQKWMNYISGTPLVGVTEPIDMVEYLKVFAKTIVPDLQNNPDVVIKYMDNTSAEKTNAVAYYMRSAIDSSTTEYITLNPLRTSSDVNDTLSTVAHEGYPGHLYAHVFSKETTYHNLLKVMSSTAYSEGWATYVQLKLYDYMKDTIVASSSNKKLIDLAIDYLYYNQLVGYLLYNKVDLMIHVDKSTISEIATYMDSLGFNGGAAEDIYRTLIEMPTGYTAYGYGMIFMNDLHIDCQAQLGDLYNEVDYNKFILSSTQTSLYELKALTEQYIADVKFMYSEK